MKTFEEKFTAWVDGRLSGEELQQFETEMMSIENAQADKDAALQLGDLLRNVYQAPVLKNPDFFNHQIMQAIETEQRLNEKPAPRPATPFFSLWRMALAGGLSLALAGGLFFSTIHTGSPVREEQNVLAKLSDIQTDDPDVTATSFQSQADNVTVLWLDGLDYIPADYALQ